MIRASSLLTILATLAMASACSSEDAPTPTTTPTPDVACIEGSPGCIGWSTCTPGFEKDADEGCREVVPAEACAPGSMPLLGERACVPVGPTACTTGFAVDPSGWGCTAVVPAKSCQGASRDALGSASCVPVGNCSAAFPPAGATHIVNAAFTDAELGPTKFRTIATAMAATTPGAIIAIDAGDYAEGIVARANVTVVGRCAEKVRLLGTALEVHGVLANGVKNAVVRGVTLVGHYEGARAMGGGTLTLEDTIVEAPRFTGLIAYEPSSSIHAERVVIRKVQPHAGQIVAVHAANADEGGSIELVDAAVTESWEAGVVATNASAPKTPSVVRLTRTVVRDTNLATHSGSGAGVVISGTSRGFVSESAILNTRRIGALTVFDAAELTITRSELGKTLEDSSGELAAGVYAEGGTITLEDVTLHDATQSGLLARNSGSIAAKGLVVRHTTPGANGAFGMGAWADSGGRLTLERAALVDNAYYGLSVITSPSKATLKDVLVRGSIAQKIDGGGLGRGVNVEDGASVDLDGVSLLANDGEGLFVRGELEDGKRARATGKRLLIGEGRTFDSTGVFIAKGAIAELDGAALTGLVRAGVIVNETLGAKGSRSEATLSHVVVRGTRRSTRRPRVGENQTVLDGFGVASSGKLSMSASTVVDNVQFGVLLGGPETTSIENCFIGSTRSNDDGTYGHGIVAFTGTTLLLRDTDIATNTIGLVFDGASAIVSGSRVRANSVGIHTQRGTTLRAATTAPEAPEPNVVVVTDDSAFVDNASRVGGGEIPLPASPFAAPTSKK